MKQIIQNNRSGETSLRECPVPALLPGAILVETAFSAISVGTEGMKIRTARQSLVGKARSRPDLVQQVLKTYKKEGAASTYRKVMNRLETPVPLGYSLAGRVIDVGPGVEGFKEGDLVACAGAGVANHAEFVSVPRNLCALVPEGVKLEHAAFSTVAAIALHGVRQAEVQLGDTVAVVGLGLLGLMSVQMLAASGARVFGFDLNDSRMALARSLGAEQALSPSAPGLSLAVSGFTNGHGFDRVIVAAADSSNRAIEFAAEVARDRGRVVLLGLVGMELNRKLFYDKELELRMSRSYGPGRYDPSYEEDGVDYPLPYVRWTEQRNLAAVMNLMATGKLALDPLLTHRMPFDRAPEAYDMLVGPEAGSIIGLVLDYGAPGKPVATKIDIGAARTPAANGTVRVSFIGAGNFAKSTLIPAVKKANGTQLATVTTSTAIGSRHAAETFGFRSASSSAADVISDDTADLVVVATRHDLHAELTARALDAGKAVFVEKPLALDEVELAAVAAALQRAARPFLHVGFNRRFAPLVTEAKAALPKSGPYTLLYRVNAGPIPANHWVHDPRLGGGRLVGEGCHFIDLLQYLVGAPPVSVTASGMADAGMYRNDNVVVTLEFADGSVGCVVYLACNDTALPKERLEVSAGGISIVLDDFRELTIARGGRVSTKKSRFGQDKGHNAQMDAVIEALREGAAPPIPVAELLISSLATLAARRSLETRAPVAIDLSALNASRQA
jgi:predicted dehydrogenase/threonine dehydrogenase-like Zn-dependent dehydrogenase